MSLAYSIREGLAGLRRARFATVAATSAMTVALVLIGLFAAVGYHAHQVTNWLRQRVGEIEIFLEDDVDENVARALYARVQAIPGVAEARYISREEARQIFLEEFGEEGEVFLDEPFLPASIRVRFEPSMAAPDTLARMVAWLSTWNHVDEVVFNQPLLLKVQQNLRLISLVGLALGLLVVLAAIFLVANTIRLTVYARRLLIRTMKLVGATDRFIRRPFVIEGMVQGLVAGLLAAGIVALCYQLVAGYLPQLEGDHGPFLLGLLGSIVLAGVMLGWFGAAWAARRFIRRVPLH
ncbi:cell division protein FtsX [Rhodothermus profundi]|uniref:Cell division protein FtsX n=1 Tax=Rhodothermus profundi TaxID=633813 RepID=A0A1M6UH84_9BACT|nr:permease-like cell division protein FtsX [Rhodothermus profundi]SHK68530.1 cell division protein FtsX [Rhodothermus profundi]